MLSKSSNTRSFQEVLADLRTTHIGTGLPSPAEILHGRNLTTRAQAEIDIKAICDCILLLLPNVMEHRSLLVVCFTFTKSPSGPPWNEGHWPKVRHETSVLEVPIQEQ